MRMSYDPVRGARGQISQAVERVAMSNPLAVSSLAVLFNFARRPPSGIRCSSNYLIHLLAGSFPVLLPRLPVSVSVFFFGAYLGAPV
jgi:hypothetical protein